MFSDFLSFFARLGLSVFPSVLPKIGGGGVYKKDSDSEVDTHE